MGVNGHALWKVRNGILGVMGYFTHYSCCYSYYLGVITHSEAIFAHSPLNFELKNGGMWCGYFGIIATFT